MDIEATCLGHLDVDYLPLHDIVREFTGFDSLQPEENEFFEAMNFLHTFLMRNKDVVYYESLGANKSSKSIDELIQWLKIQWKNKKYEDVNYAVWFDKV